MNYISITSPETPKRIEVGPNDVDIKISPDSATGSIMQLAQLMNLAERASYCQRTNIALCAISPRDIVALKIAVQLVAKEAQRINNEARDRNEADRAELNKLRLDAAQATKKKHA